MATITQRRLDAVRSENCKLKAQVAELLAMFKRLQSVPNSNKYNGLKREIIATAIARAEKTMTPQEYDKCFAQGDSINKI